MIFVDTWAWVALASKRDAYHLPATTFINTVAERDERFVTTDYILSEAITHLFRILPFAEAEHFIDGILASCQEGGDCELVYIAPDQFATSWRLRNRYRDKPDISFTDLSSMVVMQELGITDIFTGDAHFEHVGLGFRRVPAGA